MTIIIAMPCIPGMEFPSPLIPHERGKSIHSPRSRMQTRCAAWELLGRSLPVQVRGGSSGSHELSPKAEQCMDCSFPCPVLGGRETKKESHRWLLGSWGHCAGSNNDPGSRHQDRANGGLKWGKPHCWTSVFGAEESIQLCASCQHRLGFSGPHPKRRPNSVFLLQTPVPPCLLSRAVLCAANTVQTTGGPVFSANTHIQKVKETGEIHFDNILYFTWHIEDIAVSVSNQIHQLFFSLFCCTKSLKSCLCFAHMGAQGSCVGQGLGSDPHPNSWWKSLPQD